MKSLTPRYNKKPEPTPEEMGHKLLEICGKLRMQPYEHTKALKLIVDGADVNMCNPADKATPLMLCVEKYYAELTVALIEHGAALDAQTSRGTTAMIWGIHHGAIDNVMQLIKAGANVNLADDDGETPLMAAGERGHAEIVEALLKRKALPDLVNKQGYTALVLTCSSCHGGDGPVRAAKMLLDAGARLDIASNRGRTALGAASDNYLNREKGILRWPEIRNMLISKSVDGELALKKDLPLEPKVKFKK